MNRSSIISITVILAGFLTVAAFLTVHGQTFTGSPAASQASDNNQAPGNQVAIDNFSFTPPTLTVAAGSTVSWTNKDDVPHTVVESTSQKFKSKALDTDESFSYTFTEPGTYEYFCSVHPKMVAKVIVEAKK
ncbi:MAG: hypothetical protein DMG68_08505 [Acidobacteria bacterium]|nr:MAG: hypothetical protein DMG68_08505 [Acidobacteriota bacterium]